MKKDVVLTVMVVSFLFFVFMVTYPKNHQEFQSALKKCKPLYVAWLKNQKNTFQVGRGLIIIVWQFEEIPVELKGKMLDISGEQKVGDNYLNKSISRTLGREIHLNMTSTASVDGWIRLQHIVTKDGDVEIVDIKPLDSVEMKYGYGHTRVPESVTAKNNAVRVIVPRMLDGQFVLSPTASGRTGLKELRLFGKEWGDSCSMNVHIIVCSPEVANKIMQGGK